MTTYRTESGAEYDVLTDQTEGPVSPAGPDGPEGSCTLVRRRGRNCAAGDRPTEMTGEGEWRPCRRVIFTGLGHPLVIVWNHPPVNPEAHFRGTQTTPVVEVREGAVAEDAS